MSYGTDTLWTVRVKEITVTVELQTWTTQLGQV